MTSRAQLIVLLASGVLLLSACSASVEEGSVPPAPPETSAAVTAPGASPTPEHLDAGDVDAQTVVEETSTPDSVPKELANTTLGLDDAFTATSGWEQSRYEIADRSDVAGVGVDVGTCWERSNAPELEFRLANRFETLTFSVGQGNRSASSDQKLAVRVLGNEDQLDIQNVPFNEVREISVPVHGVNALKIRLFLDDAEQRCDGSDEVTAVLYGLQVK